MIPCPSPQETANGWIGVIEKATEATSANAVNFVASVGVFVEKAVKMGASCAANAVVTVVRPAAKAVATVVRCVASVAPAVSCAVNAVATVVRDVKAVVVTRIESSSRPLEMKAI